MKKVNGMTVYEPEDPCALDEYSEQLEKDLTAKFNEIEGENEQESADILTLQNKVTSLEQETEEQQGQITELQNKVNVLEDQIPTGQASGNPIHIADSTNLEAKLRLNGGDKQVVTELGENILDSTEYNGIEITEDTNTGFGLSFLPLKLGEPLAAGNYSFAMFFTDGTVSGSNVSLNLYDSNNSLVTTSSSLFNFTEEQIAEIANYRIFTNTTGLELYMGKTIQGVMLVKGSTKPSVYKEFIHASPTPNNPSKVETVGSNVNLFDKDNMDVIEGAFINSSTKKIEANANRKCFYLEISPNKTYTISREKIASNFIVGTTNGVPTVGSDIIDIDFNNNETITITASNNTNYLVCYYKTKSTDVEEEIVKKIKIEEGNQATAYSPYGMGSVGIGVSNKNLAEIELGDINPTTGKENNAAKVFRSNYIRVKNGTTYVWSVNKTLTNPLNIRLYDIDKNYIGYASFSGQKTYTVTNKDIAYLRIRCDLVGEETIDGLIVQIEEGNTSTDIVEHEQQTKTMPIQQEMLEGDYIEDVEHHGWNKLLATGNENWNKSTSYSSENYTMFFLNITGAKYRGQVKCNMFKYQQSFTEDGTFISSAGNSINIKVENSIIGGNTVESFKTFLQNKYNAGTPLIAYYQLSTPLDLELTEEQKKAQKINTYKNVTNIVADNSLATLDVTYKKDQNTVNKNYEDRIAALEAAILS
mgnify:CR=1 FL=1